MNDPLRRWDNVAFRHAEGIVRRLDALDQPPEGGWWTGTNDEKEPTEPNA